MLSACFKSIKLSQKCEHTQFYQHEKEATSTSKTLSNRFKRQKMGLCGPLLPPAWDGGRPRSIVLRNLINAILYITRAGCAWRLLPHLFPKDCLWLFGSLEKRRNLVADSRYVTRPGQAKNGKAQTSNSRFYRQSKR